MSDELVFNANEKPLTQAVENMIRSLVAYDRIQKELSQTARSNNRVEIERQRTLQAASQQIATNNQRLAALAAVRQEKERTAARRSEAHARRSEARVNKIIELERSRIREVEANAQIEIAVSQQKQAQWRHEIDLMRQRQMPEIMAAASRRQREHDTTLRMLATERRKLEVLKQQNREKNRLARQQDILNAKSQQLLISWQSIGRILAIRLGYQAFTAFTNQIRQGVRNAMEFQQAVAGVQTISQRAGMTTREWADGLQRVSDGWRLDIIEQTEAAYQALTNQVVHGAEAFEFLESANRFATAAITETNQAVRLAASVLNAYNMDVSRTEEIFRSFFKTIELGRVRAGELTEIGRVLLPGAQLGIEYQEVAAAIATLTRQGAKADEAMTFLRGIFQRLIRPTEAMKDFLGELGVATGQAAIETFGYIGFLAKLEERFKGSTEEIGELFQRIRSIVGIFGQQGQALKDLKRDYDEITNAQDSFNNAVDIMLKPAAEQFEIASSRIRNIMIRTGSDILDQVASMTNGFQDMVPVMRELVRIFKYGLAPALAGVTAAVGLLGLKLMLTPVGAAIAAITLLITTYSYLRSEAERANDAMRETMASGEAAMREQLRKEQEQIDRIRARADRIRKEERREAMQALAQTMSLASSVLDAQVRATEESLQSILKIGDATRDTLRDNIRELENGIRDADTIVTQAIKGIIDLWSEQDRTLFDWELEGRKGQQALDFISRRIETLQRQASEAARRGDMGILDNLQQEARRLVSQRRQLEQRYRQENERARQQQQQLTRRDQQDQERYNNQRLELVRRIRDADTDRDRITLQEELRKLDQDRARAVAESRDEYARIEIHQLRAITHERELVDLVKQQIAQRETLAEVAAESAEAQREALIRQRALEADLGQITEGIRAFRVQDVLALGDPQLIETQLRAQEARIKRLAELSEEAGIPAATSQMQWDFEQQTMLIRAQMLREEIKERQELLRLRMQELDATRQEATSRQSDLKEYFDSLKTQASGIRSALPELIARQTQMRESSLRTFERDPHSMIGQAAERAFIRVSRSVQVLEQIQDVVQRLTSGYMITPQEENTLIRAASGIERIFSELASPPPGIEAVTAAVQDLARALVEQQDAEDRYVTASSLAAENERLTLAIQMMDRELAATNQSLGQDLPTAGNAGIDVLERLKNQTIGLKDETQSLNDALLEMRRNLEALREQQGLGPTRIMPPASPQSQKSTQSSTSVGAVNVSIQAGPTGKIDAEQIVEAVRTATRRGMLT